MLLPIKQKNPPECFPFVTCALILINVVVFVFTSNGLWIYDEPIKQFALSYQNATPMRFITSMFLHGNIFHLLGNMWFLYLFGFAVEGRIKAIKFIILYLVAGICGDCLHLLIAGVAYPDVPSLGASGAIMGLLGASLYIFPHSLVNFFWTWGWYGTYNYGVTAFRMYWVGAYYLGLDVLLAMVGSRGVAHFAHIGGAIGGALMCVLFMVKRDSEATSDAKAVLSDMHDVSYLSDRELENIAVAKPDDPHVALNWMTKSLTSGKPIHIDCLQNFHRLFPKIVSLGHIEDLERLAIPASSTPGLMSCPEAVSLAYRLEKGFKFQAAAQTLLGVMNDPKATENDLETAIFRWAMIEETSLLNRESAARAYEDLIKRFPMSPLVSQAQSRLNNIRRTLPKT